MNMKKIVFLSLFALCLPWVLSAQSIDDDLYYVPSKKKEEKTEKKKTPAADAVVVKTNAPTTVYASPGNTTIVVKDRKGNIRDVDEYNRRYDSKDYDFSQDGVIWASPCCCCQWWGAWLTTPCRPCVVINAIVRNDTLYVDEKEDDGLDENG